MTEAELAAAFAIAEAKRRGIPEITLDELLLGCLRAASQFGIVQLGSWTIDLEEFGVDWITTPAAGGSKVAYSQAAVDLFDRAARIAKAGGAGKMQLQHLLAAFAAEDGGLMGELKRKHGVTSAVWRAEIARRFVSQESVANGPPAAVAPEYLSAEQAAEALGIHVQTLRAYVRSGKLPAMRLAGERAIRIRRSDLETVLEPLHTKEEPLS